MREARAIGHDTGDATRLLGLEGLRVERVAPTNKVLTQLHQRIIGEQLGRRGGKTDPDWASRRLLLRGRERLSQRVLARMRNSYIDSDPTAAILAT